MIIAVDFDNTLCLSCTPCSDRADEPNFPLIEKCKEAKRKGHKLILWTCRGGEWLKEAVGFCFFYGLKFDAVNENLKDREYVNISCKVIADLYVDDLAPGSIKHFMEMKL